MAFREYIADEIAHVWADGLLSRREAIRRLGLLGLGAAGAGALLAACGGDDDKKPAATSGARTSKAGAAVGPTPQPWARGGSRERCRAHPVPGAARRADRRLRQADDRQGRGAG